MLRGPDKKKENAAGGEGDRRMFFKKTSETGTEKEEESQEIQDLRKSVEQARMPDRVKTIAGKELERLAKTDPSLAEYGIGLNYLEFILSLPWEKSSKDNLDLSRAERILDEEHYALAPVKERVLEYLASNIKIGLKPTRMMVVDDEKIALENVAYALRKEGHEVHTAENGQEALDILRQFDFDLVVTDLKMRNVDGMQLLERVKAESPETELILVTGYATVDTAVDALKKGAAQYLPKPLNLDTLRQSVNEILEQRRKVHVSQGPVLCFAGPPGTGKTSIGRSIAKALERSFIRVSVAGLRDEAEMRGHRRTYVGAMPGRILSEVRRIGVNNPVFMLDELDKIGQDFRGDPASVLLEVLDPEQNKRFLDHYVDIPFDLSRVMFITTANAIERLSRPLLDRMEVIHFSSYTLREKSSIASHYLVPRQLKANGLSPREVEFSREALDKIIGDYTDEAGLRNLEREVGSVCRKVNRLLLQDRLSLPKKVEAADVEALLGPPRFSRLSASDARVAGVTTGLVWTEHGGHVIYVETARMKGQGKLIMTGSLGEVLKESAQTALSHIRSNAAEFGIDPEFFETSDVHVHIPAGSIPKDGPSAGVTIAMALVSLLTGKPVRKGVAMSGELTLSGRVLPVSGLREKLLAAQRAGISTVILPAANATEIAALEPDVRTATNIVQVENFRGAVQNALSE